MHKKEVWYTINITDKKTITQVQALYWKQKQVPFDLYLAQRGNFFYIVEYKTGINVIGVPFYNKSQAKKYIIPEFRVQRFAQAIEEAIQKYGQINF